MARTKEEYKAPETMEWTGDGTEMVTVSRFLERAERVTKKNSPKHPDKKIGDVISGVDRPVTFKVQTVKDAAGLKSFQSAVNAKTPGKGNDPLIISLNNHLIEQYFAEIKAADEAGKDHPTGNLYPSFSKVRTTDENEAMAEQVKAALVSGALKPEDIAALFGKLAAK